MDPNEQEPNDLRDRIGLMRGGQRQLKDSVVKWERENGGAQERESGLGRPLII
jgi:hypothetical protein